MDAQETDSKPRLAFEITEQNDKQLDEDMRRLTDEARDYLRLYLCYKFSLGFMQLYDDTVNPMAPYWLNDSCSPSPGPNGSCILGNTTVYAIDVDSAGTVAARLKLNREKKIRLSIKNTGHDYTGRSKGKGSLELWIHHLKDISFLNYSSPGYTGPAAKACAGTQLFDARKAAPEHGVRVLRGYCPSVGMVGGIS
ncbi:MAG: hypothetical protein Q9164_002186 [Protoblastenia rupestris]